MSHTSAVQVGSPPGAFSEHFTPFCRRAGLTKNDLEILGSLAGAFDLAPNRDEIRTFCSLIRGS